MKHGFRTSVLALLLLIASTSALWADAPKLVNYQGRLTNASGTPLAGTYSVQFTIYDAPSVGNSKWTETQNVTTDANGLFAVLLGSITSLRDTVFRIPFDIWGSRLARIRSLRLERKL
jgi:hypothetical protein